MLNKIGRNWAKVNTRLPFLEIPFKLDVCHNNSNQICQNVEKMQKPKQSFFVFIIPSLRSFVFTNFRTVLKYSAVCAA
jgi:hypothetical protein